MKKIFVSALSLASLAVTASAATVTFENGVIDGTTTVTPGMSETPFSTYEEGGFTVSSSSEISVGNYFGSGNNVIHWHYVGSTVRFALTSGENFSLESFILNSNTQVGGGSATGNEEVYLVASTGERILLPPNDWGVNTQVNFTTLDNIQYFDIVAESNVYCIGLDNITYGAAVVPEPSAALLGGLSALALLRRRRR